MESRPATGLPAATDVDGRAMADVSRAVPSGVDRAEPSGVDRAVPSGVDRAVPRDGGRPAVFGAGRPALLGGPGGVGGRVRALRTERRVSLSELARRAGIGKATLSGLEAGTRNPTLNTLHAVAAALDAPLTALVVGTPALVLGAAVEVELLRVFDDGPVTYELCRLRVPAGAEQQSPAHHIGVTEHVTVFAGVLEAGASDHPRRAGPGEHLEWAADVPHRYAAVGDLDVLASLLIRSPRPGSGVTASGYASPMIS